MEIDQPRPLNIIKYENLVPSFVVLGFFNIKVLDIKDSIT